VLLGLVMLAITRVPFDWVENFSQLPVDSPSARPVWIPPHFAAAIAIPSYNAGQSALPSPGKTLPASYHLRLASSKRRTIGSKSSKNSQ